MLNVREPEPNIVSTNHMACHASELMKKGIDYNLAHTSAKRAADLIRRIP